MVNHKDTTQPKSLDCQILQIWSWEYLHCTVLSMLGVSRCWMKDTEKALLAHYCTNLTVLGALLLSGLAMLFLVYRQIRTRDEWKQKGVTFLSIWGLSCLFGTSWGLTFFSEFGYFSTFALFVFCILNSFQGLYLQKNVNLTEMWTLIF